MTTWVTVTDPSSIWNDASGYVYAGYVSEGYVLAYAESPSPDGVWTVQSNNTVNWVVQ